MICPACEQADGFALVEKVDDFSIYRCPRCELQFADPLRYAVSYYDDHYSDGPALARLRRLSREEMLRKAGSMLTPVQAASLRWLEAAFPRESPVFDFGCGSGWFLAALESRGFRATGLEVAAAPVGVLKAKGFAVHCGAIDTLPPSWPQPAAVVLSEVVEHVPEPVALLGAIRRRLPDAVLLLSAPSPRRWNLHLRYREHHDYPPYHLTRWSEASMMTALKSAGYVDVRLIFPAVDAREFQSLSVSALLYKLGIYNMRDQGARGGGTGRSRERGLTNRLLPLAVWGLDTSRRACGLLLKPLAAYMTSRGWSSGSFLAVANPDPEVTPNP